MGIVECVPNFSEGQNDEIISKIIEAILSVKGIRLLDQEKDANHNRCVISFVGSEDIVVEGAFRGIREASHLINLDNHKGEHPRFGAADVIPFIPVSGVDIKKCVDLANELGARVAKELGIPVYLYGEAAKLEWRKNLENIRNKNFQYEQIRNEIQKEQWKPDFGPQEVGTAGASIIGARDFLIAYNVNLRTQDIESGKKIAKALRAKDGGLTFVKALAFYLEDRKMVQISMNLTNYKKTPIYRAYELVRLEAQRFGFEIAESEIVGLTPMDSLIESAKYYLRLNGFKSNQIFEKKVWEQ
jgi:glutamate formiminotransferase